MAFQRSSKNDVFLVRDPDGGIFNVVPIEGARLVQGGVISTVRGGRVHHYIRVADPTLAALYLDELVRVVEAFQAGQRVMPEWPVP